MNIKIIIPSYNPKDKLIDLVNELIKNNFDNILIIDDGSDTESKKIYSKIPKKVKIIYHDKNMGKGCALKTGIATIKKEDAFITVDSDGQHKVRSEEHTSELQSRGHLVCRLLLEKKKKKENEKNKSKQ